MTKDAGSLPPLTPAFLLAGATALIALGTTRRDADDLRVENAERRAREEEMPLLSDIGFWSHFDHRRGLSSWPIPVGAGRVDCLAWARARGIVTEAPQAGDLFMSSSGNDGPPSASGIICAVAHHGRTTGGHSVFVCQTIEPVRLGARVGLSGRRGPVTAEEVERRDPWQMVRKCRLFVPAEGDRFIRWADLDGRGAESSGRTRRSWCAGSSAEVALLTANAENPDFPAWAARYEPMIRSLAHQLAHRDTDLAADLLQEGRIALATLDRSRIRDGEAHYVRSAVRERMRLALRRERRHTRADRFIHAELKLA